MFKASAQVVQNSAQAVQQWWLAGFSTSHSLCRINNLFEKTHDVIDFIDVIDVS